MLKFIVISDTHIVPQNEVCNGLDSFKRFELAIESINNDHSNADFCILNGDIVDTGKIEEYKRFKEVKSKLNIPLYLTLGNHDNRDNFKQVFNDEYSDENGFIQKVIEIKDHRIIILDTLDINLIGEGRLCERRLNWLEENIKNNKKTPTIIIMHHHVSKIKSPYIDVIALENPKDFFKILKQNSNIRHIISGHVHISSTTIENNIPQTTIAGSHFSFSVQNFFTPFDYKIEDLKNLHNSNQINNNLIQGMTKDYDNLVILDGPSQYGVVFSDNISTTIHFHNYIEKYKRLPKSQTKLDFEI